ncbi:MAG: DUF1080 domain-containing protein [Gemmatimonadaceae bacterium]
MGHHPGIRIAASIVASGIAIATASCSSTQQVGSASADSGVVTRENRMSEWRPLFDGQTTRQWRGFRSDSLPAGWKVVDGALTRVAQGGDIITTEQFDDFELKLEWKVAPGGNSGIFFRVTEAEDGVHKSGPEMQVLDDAKHADGKRPETSAGAAYAIYPAPRGVVRPAGEWNEARLVVDGNHVEHWLNGTKVVEYELGSPDWEDRVRKTKFSETPRYGREPKGHIALQDHGDWVAYRNIMIREL